MQNTEKQTQAKHNIHIQPIQKGIQDKRRTPLYQMDSRNTKQQHNRQHNNTNMNKTHHYHFIKQ